MACELVSGHKQTPRLHVNSRILPVINPGILAFDTEHRCWCLGLDHLREQGNELKRSSLDRTREAWYQESATYIVIVAVWTVLVAFFILGQVLAEGALALFADEGQLGRLAQCVVLRLSVALGALFGVGQSVSSDLFESIPITPTPGTVTYVKELLTTWCSNGYLGVEDVFATRERLGGELVRVQ